MRLLTTVLCLISSSVFAYGFKQYFQTGSLKDYLLLSFAGLFLFWIPVQLIPHNSTFNLVIFYIGSGFFLLSLKSKTFKKIVLWGFLTGIIFSQLIFVMVTNIPVYSVILLLPFTLIKEKKEKLLLLLSIILGSISGLALFFLFIIPIHEVYYNFLKGINYLSFIDSHGVKVIIKWIISTIFYFISEIMIPSVLLLVLFTNNFNKKNIVRIIIYSLVIYALYIIGRDIIYNYTHLTSPSIIYIFIFAILMHLIINKEFKYFWLGLFILSIPFFASLGTNVKFELFSVVYIMPALLFIYFFLCQTGNKKLLFVFFVILFICLIRFSIEYIVSPGWNGYVIAGQKKSIASLNINHDILLDAERYNTLEELQEYIPQEAEVIVSNINLWGYVYLLGAKTPILFYTYNEDFLNYYLKQNPFNEDCLYLLESKQVQFPEKMNIRGLFTSIDTVPLIQNRDLTLYILKR
jgi:hypothetical protein